jgi:hypothetical protein
VLTTVPGVVQANVPATLAVPPLKFDVLNWAPTVTAEAVGATDTVGVALVIVKAVGVELASL